MKKSFAAMAFAGLFAAPPVFADQVRIVYATFEKSGDGWHVSVTLHHHDTGWDHYADQWRIVDANGKEIAKRVLLHPHVGEQPFTRGLGGVHIPAGDEIIFIEAHDKVHGWSPKRLRVDMKKAKGVRFRVER